MRPLSVALASDFFQPETGGVESHIYQLAYCLSQLGHRITIITRCHPRKQRTGVRHVTGGIKVHHLPLLEMTGGNTLPTMFASAPLIINILQHEQIELVHAHSAYSTLAHEVMLCAASTGIPIVYTDHSLTGFDDVASSLVNAVLRFSLCSIRVAICVSGVGAANMALRGGAGSQSLIQINNDVDSPSVDFVLERYANSEGDSLIRRVTPGSEATNKNTLVTVIPNAVDSGSFYPPSPRELAANRQKNRIVVVVMNRLVYRKGIDLLLRVVPRVCSEFPTVDFIIGGGGPRQQDLEEVLDRYDLRSRVQYLGAVPHSHVRDVLVKGDVFLNTSLTDAFCMGIVEAAACGAMVVSTAVGGIPEVLDEDMVILTEPSVSALVDGLQEAFKRRRSGGINAVAFHERIAKRYSWGTVAEATDRMYSVAMAAGPFHLSERLDRYWRCGPLIGILWIVIASMHASLTAILLRWRSK